MNFSYPNNVECTYSIEASDGNRVSLTIEMLDIVSSEYCNTDYLEVRELNRTGRILGNVRRNFLLSPFYFKFYVSQHR